MPAALPGRERGGLTGAVVSGASAVASAYATAGLGTYASGLGVNIGVTYSYENGFGGSVGLSYAGAGGLGGGASLNFQEGKGFTGGGVNVGYKTGGTTSSQGLNLGMNFDKSGLTGVNATYTNTTSMGGFNPGTTGGLGYNKNGTTDVIAGATVSASNPNGIGWNSAGTDMTSKFNFDSSGKFNGITQNIGLSLGYQITGGLIKKLERQKEAIQNNDKLTPAQKEAALAQADADIANAADQQHRTEGAGVATGYEVTRREHVEHEQSTGEEKPDPLGGKPLGNGEAAYLARNMANQLGVPVEGDGVVYNQVLAKLNDITGGKEATAAQIEQAAREVAADRGAPGADGDVNWDTAKQNAAYVQGVDVQRYNQAQQEAQQRANRAILEQLSNPTLAENIAAWKQYASNPTDPTQARWEQGNGNNSGLPSISDPRGSDALALGRNVAPYLFSPLVTGPVDALNCTLEEVGISKRLAVGASISANGALPGRGAEGSATVMFFGQCGNAPDGSIAAIFAGGTAARNATFTGDAQPQAPFQTGVYAGGGGSFVLAVGSGGTEGWKGYTDSISVGLPWVPVLNFSAGKSEIPEGASFFAPTTQGYLSLQLPIPMLNYGAGASYGQHMEQPLVKYNRNGVEVPLYDGSLRPGDYVEYRNTRPKQ